MRMSDDFRICPVFVALLPVLRIATLKNIKTVVGLPRHPSRISQGRFLKGWHSDRVALTRLEPSFRHFDEVGFGCEPVQMPFSFVLPTTSDSLALSILFPSLFFAHRVRHPPEHISVLRFPLIAIPQFVWIRTIQYGIIQNIIEMGDNEKWKYVRLLFEWNRTIYRNQIYLHIIL